MHTAAAATAVASAGVKVLLRQSQAAPTHASALQTTTAPRSTQSGTTALAHTIPASSGQSAPRASVRVGSLPRSIQAAIANSTSAKGTGIQRLPLEPCRFPIASPTCSTQKSGIAAAAIHAPRLAAQRCFCSGSHPPSTDSETSAEVSSSFQV